MNNETISTVIAGIQESAANDISEMRVMPSDAPIGSTGRQGDIYITRIDKPDMARLTQVNNHQLAPGTSQGSRHTVADHVPVYHSAEFGRLDRATNRIVGPILYCEERFRVMHPEHPDQSYPAGWWQVGYQLDPRTLQRVKD